MFTGLVEGIGRIKEMRRAGRDMVLSVEPLIDGFECRIGDSIAVDGVCLTVTGTGVNSFSVDVSAETLSRCTLGGRRLGDEVNLERALLPTSRLGGHLVQGHVDGVGRIVKKEQRQGSWLLGIGIDKALSRYTISKGSVAVDGISLTINRCKDEYFEVNIIPQTGRETTILKKNAGDPVNIETDLIGRYVEKFMTERGSPRTGLDRDTLRKYGFSD